MLKNITKKSVNVYTEWAPLREIIVGNSINYNMEGCDDVFHLLYRDNVGIMPTKKKKTFRLLKQYASERQEDLDNFSKTLERFGVIVKRPMLLDAIKTIKTPYFTAVTNAANDPRDIVFCIGNEIIETPPTNRNRYFEGLMFYHIFSDYFRRGAKWTMAPRTRLSLESIDQTHWKKVKKLHSINQIESGFDVAFDAANCLKFGKDILMNVGNKNNELGAMWLQRHLGKKFRVHPVRITDWHIDGMIIPLKPGVLWVNPLLKKKLRLLPAPLQKWKIIEAPDGAENKFSYPKQHLQLASFTGMSVNILSLNEHVVFVRSEETQSRRILEKEGFTVVPVQMRHCELFGGGLHCATLDVNRKETLTDYWN